MDPNEYADREIKHLRAEFHARVNALEEARELQALEYERRLSELNHAHTLAAEAVLLTVPRALYDADREAASARLYAIRDQVMAASTERASQDREAVLATASRRQIIQWVVTAGLVIGGWIVNWAVNRP